MYNITPNKNRSTNRNKISKRPIIGFFLSQPKLKDDQDLVFSYSLLIERFVTNGYQVKLFSMCYNNISSESDTIVNNVIFSMLDKKIKQFVKIILSQNLESNILTLKYAICERFHAHILALIANVPFISYGNTYKVAHLLSDLGLGELQMKSLTFIDVEEKLKIVAKRWKKLRCVFNKINTDVSEFYMYFSNSPNSPNQNQNQNQNQNHNKNHNHNKTQNNNYNQNFNYSSLFDTHPQIKDYSCNKVQLYINTKQINTFCGNLYNEYKNSKHQSDYVLMKLFGTTQLDYKWGVDDKIQKYQFTLDDIKWLFEESAIKYSRYLYSYFTPSNNINNNIILSNEYNIDYIDQYDRSGVHRHGWKYVIDNLSNQLCTYMHNTVKCDLYVDRTFHWNRIQMIEAGIIPYTTPWVGVIHHTLYQDESGYNCIELLKCKEFITSLKVCKSLIVLSDYLKNCLLKLANEMNIKLPTIHVMYHPTLLVDKSKLWKYGKWKWNSWNGEVIQIGSWMRDIKAIYDLKYKKKYALIGKDMLDKYKSISFGDTQPDYLNEEDAVKIPYPVSLIKYVDNEKYDEILSKFVVFLKLNDASAVNTIIECISRNTPIIVNKLPAVEEYLGPKYPLYYTDINDVPRLLKNKLIIKANTYLKNMNKDFLKIETFINSMKLISS
jgi:hypothetical protein